jgi:hypothetical protein
MATSRAYADLDGDGVADEIVGRLYGDTKEEPGDLRADLGHGWVSIPTEAGVRALLVAPSTNGRSVLYFADGWVAAYGSSGKAQMKRASYSGSQFIVEPIVASPDEYTFFELIAVPSPAEPLRIVARGNQRVSLASVNTASGWSLEAVVAAERILGIAVGRDARGIATVYVPEPDGTKALPLPQGVRQRGATP